MRLRRATPLMRVMFVCARAQASERGEERGDGWETGGGGRSLCGD